MTTQQPEPICAGCALVEHQAIRHEWRSYCPSCPSLPADKRREPRPADPVRAGLAELLKKGR